MPSNADLFGLVDPICHMQVDASSPHHCVHGGARFYFCSDECRTRFASDPSRWAVSSVLGGVRSGAPVIEGESGGREAPVVAELTQDVDSGDTVTYRRPLQAAEPVSSARIAETQEQQRFASDAVNLELDIPEATARTPLTEPTGQFTRSTCLPEVRPTEPDIDSSHAATPALPPNEQALSGDHQRWFSPLTAWRERHAATSCCRELLQLYHTVAAEHPGLAGMALYRQVVMARTGHDASTADSILRLAEESFSSWPVSRDLNFRDVVHYLAVSEFLASHPESRWIQADMRRIVQSSIPHNL
jgi:YHS domain-containing protein